MKRCAALFVLCLLAALGGCGPTVSVDYDPGTSFAGLNTFDWAPVTQPRTGDARIDANPLLHKRVQHAIENQLTAQGFTRKTDAAPDFLVGYHTAINEQVAVTTMNNTYGYGGGWGRRYSPGGYRRGYDRSYSRTYVDQYEQGTLVVDISLPEKRQLIWRATAEAELDSMASQADRDKRLAEAVRQMLEQFPPVVEEK